MWNITWNEISEGVQHLTTLVNLHTLINGANLLDSNISALTNLKVLSLSYSTIEESTQFLSTLTNLNSLSMIGCSVGMHAQHLSRLTNLKKLDIDCNALGENVQYLSTLTNLEYLGLDSNGIGGYAHVPLALPKLRALSLRDPTLLPQEELEINKLIARGVRVYSLRRY